MAAVRFPIGAFLVSPMAAISFSSVASNLPQGSLILFIALPGIVNFWPIGLLCPPPPRKMDCSNPWLWQTGRCPRHKYRQHVEGI